MGCALSEAGACRKIEFQEQQKPTREEQVLKEAHRHIF
jgi:hypothetical protein